MAKIDVANIYAQIENWNLLDLERLQFDLESLIKTAKEETCLDCENRPQNGACFYCKMD